MVYLKKLVTIVICLGLSSNTLWAQWSYGVKGGLNLSNVKCEAWDPMFKIGVQAGGFVKYHFNDAWSLQTELLYSLQGCRFEVWESNMEENKIMFKRNTHYLNMPILAHFHFTHKFFLEFGPQIGFQIAAYQKYNNERHHVADTKPVDVALIGGLGYFFNEHWEMDVRYIHGFLPVTKYWGSDDNKATNRSIQLSVGYMF